MYNRICCEWQAVSERVGVMYRVFSWTRDHAIIWSSCCGKYDSICCLLEVLKCGNYSTAKKLVMKVVTKCCRKLSICNFRLKFQFLLLNRGNKINLIFFLQKKKKSLLESKSQKKIKNANGCVCQISLCLQIPFDWFFLSSLWQL